ncbi:uncharacterized protein PgNI_01351 [Pyricularia grisea]|uniref:Uncharacterized protein n=5 Tax=Pyricularia TaxID=48558 RepID=A0A6P8BJT4_PYRGI|nr:uncharacterized protein PgNI_01351 [Pyricularia grisea]TLD16945.1 hypothetical protein PgNI_01351 [Pyricularia grisea]
MPALKRQRHREQHSSTSHSYTKPHFFPTTCLPALVCPRQPVGKMVKQNDVIAIIIIILFIVLAGISFGIYKLVSMARSSVSVTSSSSTGSTSLVDDDQ